MWPNLGHGLSRRSDAPAPRSPRFVPYDRPVDPALHLRTDQLAVEESVEQIMALLEARGVLRAPSA